MIHRKMLLVMALVLTGSPALADNDTPEKTVRRVEDEVTVMRVPDGGFQPQAVSDAMGTVHLVYLKGDPKACDVYYARLQPGGKTFSTPLRVNSQPGSAVAVGTIRGAQLARGRNGRVHIAWNGSQNAMPKPLKGVPMLYARLNDAGAAFEPQRNLMAATVDLDGGGSVAADAEGNVYVMWHGARPGNEIGETGRSVFLARSPDDGKTFKAEEPIGDGTTGACGCCGMKALANGTGRVFALFRAAGEKVNRDLTLLFSSDGAKTFSTTSLHPWKLNQCPMSSAALIPSVQGAAAGWETGGQIFWTRIDGRTGAFNPPGAASAKGGCKHPALAANARGETLAAWTEGTAWQKGGAVGWQVFDSAGRPKGAKGHAEDLPVWGTVAAFTTPGGGFGVVY